ncbi:MAG TPA: FAD-dependent oxidoreductase [Patescibacteria group bacterium]|nr:FAD-dependent oxidoreductase [Patescibacteria group bacterium]
MKEDQQKTEIVVLGAGLAGLAAADKLASQGAGVMVIEKENSVGGMCRSLAQDGFIFDLGGHRFLPHNQQTADYVSSLFPVPGELALRDRLSQIYLKGKFLAYPPEFADILKNLGPITCLKSGIDSLYFRLTSHLFRLPAEISLKDWMMRRFGPTLYDIYFGPYSYKLWGRKTSGISAEWASQRISVPNMGLALRNLLFKKDKHIKTYARQFVYPQGGIGQIPRRIAEHASAAGARILTGHRLAEICPQAQGFLLTVVSRDGTPRKILADKVISTIPLNEFIFSFRPLPPADVLDAARGLHLRSVRFLNVMLDTSQITSNTWIYVPERKFIFFRIQEVCNWHPANCPPGKTALTLEVACEEGGRLWRMPDADLLKFCVHDLAKMGIAVENKILGYFSTYAPHAYPVYLLDYKERLRKIYAYLQGFDPLVIAGRQGRFRYLNMDAALEEGFLAARALDDENNRREMFSCDERKDYTEKGLYLKINAR